MKPMRNAKREKVGIRTVRVYNCSCEQIYSEDFDYVSPSIASRMQLYWYYDDFATEITPENVVQYVRQLPF